MKKLLLLIVFWLCWGFSIGTFVLLYPMRMIIDFAREHHWPELTENLTAFLFIALLVIVSYLLAKKSAEKVSDNHSKNRILHAGMPAIAAIIALFVMLNPAYHKGSDKSTILNAQFTIGPYPTKEKIEALKDSGYTAIISLLHPAVVPFEPKLLKDEILLAEEEDMEVISIPMLPWVSDNEESIMKLKNIVKNAAGKYYIHCYLGKDRVNVARRIIEQTSSDRVVLENGIQRRSIDDINTFERGTIYKLADSIYLTPLPTEEEYLGIFWQRILSRLLQWLT